jgi:RNA polymerase sigma factor (sigma-70 family)
MMSTGTSADAERFARLFRGHYHHIQAFARRRVGDRFAQEIVAETFLVAWRRLHDVPEPALPWLYRVAAFEVANLGRRQARDVRLQLVLAQHPQPDLGEVSDPSEAVDQVRQVRRAFALLPSADQEVLRLAAWEGLSTADGALVLGCSEAAYRVRLHRARARLARKAGLRGRTGGTVEASEGHRAGDGPPTLELPTVGCLTDRFVETKEGIK